MPQANEIFQYTGVAGFAGICTYAFKILTGSNRQSIKNYEATIDDQAEQLKEIRLSNLQMRDEMKDLRSEVEQGYRDRLMLIRIIRDSGIDIKTENVRQEDLKRLGL